jgi:hypothetical protein
LVCGGGGGEDDDGAGGRPTHSAFAKVKSSEFRSRTQDSVLLFLPEAPRELAMALLGGLTMVGAAAAAPAPPPPAPPPVSASNIAAASCALRLASSAEAAIELGLGPSGVMTG